jgi:hypothetical protein
MDICTASSFSGSFLLYSPTKDPLIGYFLEARYISDIYDANLHGEGMAALEFIWDFPMLTLSMW